MKRLLSTGASRAWLAVCVLGIVVIALGLQLLPRLSAGEGFADATKPLSTEAAVSGEVGGARMLSRYVQFADPLVTKGGAAREVDGLTTTIAQRAGVSRARAGDLLRRTAPHTEALLRALPFSGIERERASLTSFLSTSLNTTDEDAQNQLAQNFPRLFAVLSQLTAVTGGWRNIPGAEGLERFDSHTTVKSVPDFAGYVRDDLTGTVARESDELRYFAGWGGVGYIPYLLLIAGVVLACFGLVHARWAVNNPAGKRAWGFVVFIGVLVMVVVGALQYFPRFSGASRAVDRLQPAFDAGRVERTRAGADLVQQTVRFADPLMTPSGGAADEVPRLVTYISERAGLTATQVRGRLRKAAPETSALLDAIPLTEVAREQPRLTAFLSRKLGLPGSRLDATLRRRTPGIAQALLAVGSVTSGWNRIPGADGLQRFDGVSAVRTMPEYAEYLDQDVLPVLDANGGKLRDLASSWPALKLLPPIVLGIGALLAIYAMAMMFLVTPRRRRAS